MQAVTSHKHGTIRVSRVHGRYTTSVCNQPPATARLTQPVRLQNWVPALIGMSPLLGGKWHWMISYDCLPLAHCYTPFTLLTYFTEWLIFFQITVDFCIICTRILFYFILRLKIKSSAVIIINENLWQPDDWQSVGASLWALQLLPMCFLTTASLSKLRRDILQRML